MKVRKHTTRSESLASVTGNARKVALNETRSLSPFLDEALL